MKFNMINNIYIHANSKSYMNLNIVIFLLLNDFLLNIKIFFCYFVINFDFDEVKIVIVKDK